METRTVRTILQMHDDVTKWARHADQAGEDVIARPAYEAAELLWQCAELYFGHAIERPAS